MAPLRTALGISIFVGLVGCADTGGQTLLILNNSDPGAGCVVTPTEGSHFLPSGRIDALGVTMHNSTIGYLATPTIKNLADSQDGKLTTERTVILHGARIDVSVGNHPDGTPILDATATASLDALNALKYTAPFAGSIAPDGALAGVAFEAVPAAVIAAIGPTLAVGENALVTTSFSVFGKTTSGGNVESDAFDYPVTVCNGCLFTDLGSCVGLVDGDYPAGGVCGTFQDGASACCTTSTGLFVCPAAPEAAAN